MQNIPVLLNSFLKFWIYIDNYFEYINFCSIDNSLFDNLYVTCGCLAVGYWLISLGGIVFAWIVSTVIITENIIEKGEST